MLQHNEIKLLKITERQKNMLLAIADYNEGWIGEDDLEKKLRKVLMVKDTPMPCAVKVRLNAEEMDEIDFDKWYNKIIEQNS
jgi:hypothetical protein